MQRIGILYIKMNFTPFNWVWHIFFKAFVEKVTNKQIFPISIKNSNILLYSLVCFFVVSENLKIISFSAFQLYLTGPFTILELFDQEINIFYGAQKHRPTDFEAPKLRKSSSGS